MEIYCQVTQQGLIPLYDSDLEQKRRLKTGSTVLCRISKPRNLRFHKKFFALLRLTFDNLPEHLHASLGIYSEEDMLMSVKIDLGLTTVVRIAGRDVLREGSISFAAMDETEFDGFYHRTVNLILHKYLRGTDRQALLDEVRKYY